MATVAEDPLAATELLPLLLKRFAPNQRFRDCFESPEVERSSGVDSARMGVAGGNVDMAGCSAGTIGPPPSASGIERDI